jgi:hypothetical protein
MIEESINIIFGSFFIFLSPLFLFFNFSSSLHFALSIFCHPNSLLSQYRLCAAGIGLGTAYSLRYKKGLVPMVAAGAIGTTADMVYGYLVECAEFRQGDAADAAASGILQQDRQDR